MVMPSVKPVVALPLRQVLLGLVLLMTPGTLICGELVQVNYNHPGLVVDLDLVVVCPDKPSNGTYFFENPGGAAKMPVFKPAVRVSKGLQNVQVSYVNGRPRILTPGYEYPQFLERGLEVRQQLPVSTKVHQAQDYGRPNSRRNAIRANQWKYVDYNGDGHQDLMVGIGDWAWVNSLGDTPLDETGIVAIRNETNFVAVWFACYR